VTPVYTANIINQVAGQVTAVHYAEGQMVGKGTPLVEIDPRPFQATLMEAQGTLERDQSLLAQAQMDLDRYKAAWAKNAIPKQTLDDQEKLVDQDKGTVKIDQGTVQFDEVQLAYCHIVSPISGKVGLRLVDPGNVLAANGTSPLAVVAQIQPITVVFSIPEDSLSMVQPRLKQHAKLAVDALDRSNQNKVGSGTLLTLDNQIDTTTGTVKARASFANTDGSLYPNEFVNARLLVNTLHDATLVPSSTIQHNGNTAFVFVLDGNVAHLRNITEGVTDGGTTAVTGINPGDTVANSGFEKLQEGSKVQISTGNGGGGGKSGKGAKAASTTSGSSAP
jgi:membrane fusion protein, multidrug efflux system